MNVGFRIAGALALLLVGIIALEIGLGGAEPPVGDAAELASLPTLPAPVPPQDQSAERASTIIARPLFTPGRRPTPVPTPAAAQVAQVAPPPRLTGTLVGSFGKRAFFAGDGKSRSAGESDRIGRWTVHTIGVGYVTLMGPEGPRELRVAFDTGQPNLVEAAAALSGNRAFWSNPCGRPHRRSVGGRATLSDADSCRAALALLAPVGTPSSP